MINFKDNSIHCHLLTQASMIGISKAIKNKYCLLLIMFMVTAFDQLAFSQTDTATTAPHRLSVEKDMLVDDKTNQDEQIILSPLRIEEPIFNSSTSAYVITSDMLKNSSISTIAEAMTMVPGAIVRQTTNGNFEVCFQGNDYMFKKLGSENDISNKIFLVLINNVPINNNWYGGVNWEAIPVGLNDIERIEVYRTPQSASLGSEAITGAVNIITKREIKNGVGFSGDIKGDNYDYAKAEANITAGINDKIKLMASANYFSTRRFDDSYYILGKNKFTPSDSLLFYQADAASTNKYPSLAIERQAINLSANYTPAPKYDFWLTLSHQDEKTQTPFTDKRLILLNQTNQVSNSIGMSAHIYNAKIAASFKSGTFAPAVGINGYSSDARKLFIEASYPIKLKKGIDLLFGANLQSSSYDNSAGSSNLGDMAIGAASFSRISSFVSASYQVNPALELLGSYRYEYVPAPYKNLNNVQISATYLLNAFQIFRASASISERPPYFLEIFTNASTNPKDFGLVHVSSPFTTEKTKYINIGYRQIFNTKLNADFDTYISILDGSNYFNGTTRTNTNINSVNTGATGSLNYKTAKFDASVFVCVQHSKLEAFGQTNDNMFTPRIYGGAYFNMSAFYSKLNINAHAYFYGTETFESAYGTYSVKPNAQMSIKISYRLKTINSLYVNIKNLGFTDSPNYPYADKTKVLLLLGVNFNLTSI